MKMIETKIAVMAGTPIDTKMGSELLINELRKINKSRKKDYPIEEKVQIIEIPISENPVEQTVFQTSKPEYKERILKEHIIDIKRQGCDILFVYCNSLSGSVDFDKLSEENDIYIITPFAIYSELAHKYNKIAVISANAQGLAGIESILFQNNKNIQVVGITLLELVKEIENGTEPEIIAGMFNFDMLIKYLENQNIEAIMLGCTHFPYMKEEIKKLTNLEIIDPGLKMVDRVENKIS